MHLERYSKNAIINFFESYINEIDKDLSSIKLNINTQTRVSASCYLNGLAANNWFFKKNSLVLIIWDKNNNPLYKK